MYDPPNKDIKLLNFQCVFNVFGESTLVFVPDAEF